MTTDSAISRQLLIFDALDSLGIRYKAICHDPVFNMQDGQKIAQLLEVTPCKNLLLCNRQAQFYLALLAGDKRVSVKDIAAQIGSSHLSFANEGQLKELLCASPGCVSPLELLFDKENHVQLLVDKDVLSLPYIGCHPCTNTCSIRLRLTDLLEVFLPYTHHSSYKILQIPI